MRIYSIIAMSILSAGSLSSYAAAPIVDLTLPPENTVSTDIVDTSQNVDDPSLPDLTASRQSLPVDQRVRLLEQQISNMMQMNLPAKINQLEQQIQQLNGQLEEQAHHIQQLQQQQPGSNTAENRADLTTVTGPSAPAVASEVIKEIPAPIASTVEPASQENTPASEEFEEKIVPANPVKLAETAVVQNKPQPKVASRTPNISEEKAYQNAFDLMVKKKNTAALTAFQNFVKTYPNSTAYGGNAHYWLGELYSSSNKPTQAANEFTTLIQQYPTHAKVPDAMLKLAIIHDAAGKHAQAKQELRKVVQQFPDSGAAKLAKMRLQTNT